MNGIPRRGLKPMNTTSPVRRGIIERSANVRVTSHVASTFSRCTARQPFGGISSGVAANWLAASLRAAGLNPDALPEPKGKGMRHDHLPESAKPWKTLWSAGQGIDLIDDIPTVADLVAKLKREYAEACQIPAMV